MIIRYLKDADYLLIDSEQLDNAWIQAHQYSKVVLSGDVNCGACDELFAEELPLTKSAQADLDEWVKLSKVITRIEILNSDDGTTGGIDTAIYLSKVHSFCVSGGCTLETTPWDAALEFQTAIENYFEAIGVATPPGGITVAFDDNDVIIWDLPYNYAVYKMTARSEAESLTEYDTYFSVEDTDSQLIFNGDGLLVSPSFFNMDSYVDGVYRFDLKIVKIDGSYTLESNCYFLDINFKCQVATYLDKMLKESTSKSAEKVGTTVHMLHYAMVNSSNCGCNCADLCKAYKELYSILNTAGLINSTTSSNCGC